MILDRSLLLAARSLLRVLPPQRVLTGLRRVGGLFPPLREAREVRRASAALRGRGSCLARSIAIAARTPTAAVAIGVDPKRAEGVFAHAWLEIDGAPVDPAEPTGQVIARL